MGVLKNRHGVYVARKKVPKDLEEAVARVLADGRARVSWLQKSLGTKEAKKANAAALPVLMEFDAVLAKAAALMDPLPRRESLNAREITTIADYHYASVLEEDEDMRRDGSGSEVVYLGVAQQLAEAGVAASSGFRFQPARAFGLSDRELATSENAVEVSLPEARKALARGDISFVEYELEELLDIFRFDLDPTSSSYRELGSAVLKRHIQALENIASRNKGEIVDTPQLVEPCTDTKRSSGSSLNEALEGWKKATNPTANSEREFAHAVRRFIELHGDLRIEEITRRHVREFREALQSMPKNRSKALQAMDLVELVEWSKRHPDFPRIARTTVNKLLTGMQAITRWGYDNGLVPDHTPWADPFARMRLDADEPDREPWKIDELKLLFGSRVYTASYRPKGGGGEAAYWLPLLALFTGARQGELAPLTVANISKDERTGVSYLEITADEERGVRVKTNSSKRIVPVHPELERLGFLELVQGLRQSDAKARLFPLLTKGARDGFAESWSKWFGRYLTEIGIPDDGPVFHSFRHNFKDALRAAAVSEDINDALTGHKGGGVGRSYGAKDMASRFGMERLAEAVSKARYPGLDLSHLGQRPSNLRLTAYGSC